MGLECNFMEAIESLNNLDKRVSEELIDKALDNGSEPILEAQNINVPVGDTGELKKSLGKGKKTGKKTNRKIDIGIINAHEREVVYGYYQEHGTERMAGKKWMKKAYIKSKDEANKLIKETIVKGILENNAQ